MKRNTVLGPIPLKRESSALISSIDKPRKYSKHNLPLLSSKHFKIFLIQAALVGAKPPHLIAFSMHFCSAARTLNQTHHSTMITEFTVSDQCNKKRKGKLIGKLTCSQVGKVDLRDAKALRELASVVFWESSVLTKPSKTLSSSPSSYSLISNGTLFLSRVILCFSR